MLQTFRLCSGVAAADELCFAIRRARSMRGAAGAEARDDADAEAARREHQGCVRGENALRALGGGAAPLVVADNMKGGGSGASLRLQRERLRRRAHLGAKELRRPRVLCLARERPRKATPSRRLGRNQVVQGDASPRAFLRTRSHRARRRRQLFFNTRAGTTSSLYVWREADFLRERARRAACSERTASLHTIYY